MHATVGGAGSAAGYARNPGELVRKPVNAQTEDNVPVKAHNPGLYARPNKTFRQ